MVYCRSPSARTASGSRRRASAAVAACRRVVLVTASPGGQAMSPTATTRTLPPALAFTAGTGAACPEEPSPRETTEASAATAAAIGRTSMASSPVGRRRGRLTGRTLPCEGSGEPPDYLGQPRRRCGEVQPGVTGETGLEIVPGGQQNPALPQRHVGGVVLSVAAEIEPRQVRRLGRVHP